MATPDLARLAGRVKAHRLELFPSRKAAADVAGISKDTWQRVEEGMEVRESTYAKIDRVLGWAIGSCVAITVGGEPVLADTPGGNGSAEAAGAELSSPVPADVVKRAAFEAARSKLPTAQIGDIDDFATELVEVLRRAGMVKDGD